jgi:hypothetical protein
MAAKQEKRGPGRPATGKQPHRSIRASDEDWNNWQTAAEHNGQSLAAWMRDILNRAARRQLRDKR